MATGRMATWSIVTGTSRNHSPQRMHLPKAGADREEGLRSEGQPSWQWPRVWPCSRLKADVELMPPPIQVCGELFTGVSGNRIRVES